MWDILINAFAVIGFLCVLVAVCVGVLYVVIAIAAGNIMG